MHHAYRLDGLRLVRSQRLFDQRRIRSVTPIAGNEVDGESEPGRKLLPERGELAGLRHQYAIAGRKRIDQRGFPGAGTRGGIDDHVAAGLEYGFHAFQYFLAEHGEAGTAMIHRRKVDRAQHAIGHVVGPGICRKWRPL